MADSRLNLALAEADRCVKCGLCLPHCPTYQLYSDENESPRGRIAIAEAVLKETIGLDETAQKHLERCLLCHRCEAVCPSHVNYTQVIDTVRAKWQKPSGLTALTTQTRLFNLANHIARALPRLKSWPTPIRIAQALGKSSVPKPGIYPTAIKPKGRIGFFLGCVTRSNQGSALKASLKLLNTLGYEVVIPENQRCCGAIPQHQGDLEQAQRFAQQNQQAFPDDLDAIVSTASGCAAHWHQNSHFSPPALDIVAFLKQQMDWGNVQFKPLDKTVALYEPCTSVNVLHNEGVIAELLQHIPNLTVTKIGKAGSCCGAAGSHILHQREQACQLRQPILDELAANNADYLATNNIGCAMHLAEGAFMQNIKIKTLHPVELLARQLISR
jgi:glycolate oxidase iron-sulfur subunit